MFENSLNESSVQGPTKKPLTVVVSCLAHGILVTILLLIPLFHTDALSDGQLKAFLGEPIPPPPGSSAPGVVELVASESVFVEEVQIDRGVMIPPREIPTRIFVTENRAPGAFSGGVGRPGVPGGSESGTIGGIPYSIPEIVAPPLPTPPPLPPASPPSLAQVVPERIGGSVMQGKLLKQVQPEYPYLARTARIQGVVVLEATIGSDGRIQNLRVISGHRMLQEAAADAVRQWVYQPYLLNGQAVPVTTTVTVTFSIR